MISPLLLSGAVGATLLGAGVLALDRLALGMIRPAPRVRGRGLAELPFPARSHHFESLGQRLQGWLVEPVTDAGGAVVVLVHGWGSSHGRMARLAAPLLEKGHPAFLFDVRHHGIAPPAPYVTARHYRDDILAACREVALLFPDRPRVLIGHSMGGSCGILAVAEGAPVQGLVTVAAPADLWEVWAYAFDRRGLPGRQIIRLLRPFWRVRAGVPFRTLDPRAGVRRLGLPLLILHGDRDESVGVGHARILGSLSGEDPVILRGQGHSTIVESEELRERLLAFVAQVPSE